MALWPFWRTVSKENPTQDRTKNSLLSADHTAPHLQLSVSLSLYLFFFIFICFLSLQLSVIGRCAAGCVGRLHGRRRGGGRCFPVFGGIELPRTGRCVLAGETALLHDLTYYNNSGFFFFSFFPIFLTIIFWFYIVEDESVVLKIRGSCVLVNWLNMIVFFPFVFWQNVKDLFIFYFPIGWSLLIKMESSQIFLSVITWRDGWGGCGRGKCYSSPTSDQQ